MTSPGQVRLSAAFVGWLVLPMILTLLWGRPDDQAGVLWCLANGALGMIAIGIGIVLHELAHAAAARVLRLELVAVWIGVGPQVAHRTIRRVVVYLHAIPTAGRVVFVAHSRRWLRTRLWWTILAGPMCNLVLGIGAIAWIATLGRDFRQDVTSGLAWWSMFGIVNGAIGGANLFPSGANDGALLLRGLAGGLDTDNLIGAGHLLRGERAYADDRLDDALIDAEAARRLLPRDAHLCDNLVALVAIERDDFATAETTLRAALATPSLAPLRASIFQNNLAWTLVVRGDAADVDEALALSEAALAAQPKVSSIHGTRGAALVAAGRAAEGLPHLQRALAGATTDRNRTASHAWLAIGHAQQGQLDAARAHLADARRLHPASHLVARAAAAVSS